MRNSADLLDYSTRIADCHSVSGNVPHNHAPGSNDTIVANRHARTNDAMSSKPDIVPDVYWFCRLQPAASNLCINRVEGGVDVNTRPNLSIVP